MAKLKAAATLRVAANADTASTLDGLGDRFNDFADADCGNGDDAALVGTDVPNGDCGRLPRRVEAAGTGDALRDRAAVMVEAMASAA